ncbi:MAG: DNA polymerase III subunit alpha [Candidatus Dojkabacteria bacterium]|nr:DNA polymerase III subunit alpha [Candidatus Dojkabacteria bacterium]
MADFVHLHVHTQYSLLDGMNKAHDMLQKVKDSGMDSVAITDHGVLYGLPELWKASKDYGVKTIFGCEIYLSPKEMGLRQEVDGIRYYHLLLLAKNKEGYQNLVKLVTKSHLDGMYYKPRIDLELLKKYSKGLICSSACLAGPISRHIVRDELDKAEWWLKQLHGIFKDDFYLEIQRNGITCEDKQKKDVETRVAESELQEHLETIKAQIKVNKQLYKYSDQYKIPVFASTDAHYLNDEDREVQKVLFCIRDGRKLDDPNGLNGYLETYIKTPEELLADFADMPEVLEETLKINEKIESISLKPDRVQPQYWNLPKDSTAEEELRKQTYEGAIKKFGEEVPENINTLSDNEKKKYIPESVVKQIDYELSVIKEMGYNDYFLVVGDIMQFARKSEIVVGVRGSAAGCLAAYCLGITNVNPITWSLVFERFLNLERASPPDIDMDIQDDRREELIDYAREKYGEDAVAGIITFGKMATKAAIRDVARVLDIDLAIADKLSKKVIVLFGKPYSFDKMMDEDPEFKAMVDNSSELQRLGQIVKKVEGLNRHTGVHAAGYLITPGPIDNYMAYQRDSKDPKLLVTQMDGNWVDKLDYMKFDFLGLRTLTIIKDTILYVRERHGINIDLEKVVVDPDEDPSDYDKKAFEVFQKGETIGVFQFESPPMQKYLMKLKPRSLGDICFMAAAYRPGPMQYIADYIDIRNGKKDAKYVVPELEPILKPTLGFPVYQEQLLQICMKLGGFTLGEGDVIRNALKKKQLDILKSKEGDFKEYFLKNYEYGQDKADEIWGQLEPFAQYGFNKAHASGYAVVAYWCAYLKGNYPLEFTTALMHADLGNTERIVIDIKEAKRLGFEILPPSINHSFVYFKPEGENGIRFGLGGIKNVGTKVCEAIIKEREEGGEFSHLDDFIKRVGTKNLNKRSVECLVKVGAMDTFGDRNQLLAIIPEVFQKCEKDARAEEIGQTGFFINSSEEHDSVAITDMTVFPTNITEATERDKMNWERELVGLYVTVHPMEKFTWTAVLPNTVHSSDIEYLTHGTPVKLVGMLSTIKYTFTKKDNSKMAIVRIEDAMGNADAVIFPRAFEKLEPKELIAEGRPFIIEGSVNVREDSKSIIINDIKPAGELMRPTRIKVDIRKIHNEEKIKELKSCFNSEGELEVEIVYGGKGKNAKTAMMKADYNDEACLKVLSEWVVI